MFRQTAVVLLTCSALTIAGCSDDDDPVVDSGESGGGADAETSEIYRISFTNLTTGQPMTPPVVALHDAGTHLFQIGTAASTELQEIAENGNNDPMVALAGSLEAVSASGVAFADPAVPGPFFPGETASVILETTSSDQVLSAVNMVVCTNDGFAGGDSLALPTDSEAVSFDVLPYDAGTEINVLEADYWVAPCGGSGENLHDDENGVTGPHPGQTGVGDFDFDGAAPVLRIEVQRLESTAGTYEIAFTNNSIGQPMTPPVAAIHDSSVSLFSVGSAASNELREIAENGNNEPMVALAGSLAEVSAAGVAFVDAENPGPMQPGETATVTLESDAIAHVFSAVNMVVCTNDGFTGANSVELPTGSESVTFEVLPYDAGTELNELDPDYWVEPCGGSGENLHEDENGVIAAHPGQTGTGNFDFVGTDSIMSISITRVEATVEEETEETSEETGEETVEPGVATGAGDEILAASGNAEIYRTGIVTHFAGSLDAQAWTFFVPSDSDLTAAGVTALTAPQLQAHILSSGALDPTALAGAGSVTASDGSTTYTVATDADGNLTVGGNVVELIGTGAMGAQIYSIAGVLGASST